MPCGIFPPQHRAGPFPGTRLPGRPPPRGLPHAGIRDRRGHVPGPSWPLDQCDFVAHHHFHHFHLQHSRRRRGLRSAALAGFQGCKMQDSPRPRLPRVHTSRTRGRAPSPCRGRVCRHATLRSWRRESSAGAQTHPELRTPAGPPGRKDAWSAYSLGPANLPTPASGDRVIVSGAILDVLPPGPARGYTRWLVGAGALSG
jgi:hypothetical protein